MALKILVVDDDDMWRDMLKRALGTAGYDLMEAENGQRGLELCDEYRPDLVITDVFMPEQDGLEILLSLCRRDHKPKILAISGSGLDGMVDFLSFAAQFGADKVLRKPFSRELLLAAVHELIGDAA